MSNFEYRVWDNEHDEYFEPTFKFNENNLEEILISPNGDLMLRTENGLIHESIFPERFVKERYTGLIDKHGNNIFEGDIVKQTFNVEWNGTEHFGYEDAYSCRGYAIGEVVILPSKGVCLKNYLQHIETEDEIINEVAKNRYKNIRAYRSEVIGNIHTNQEIIKEEK